MQTARPRRQGRWRKLQPPRRRWRRNDFPLTKGTTIRFIFDTGFSINQLPLDGISYRINWGDGSPFVVGTTYWTLPYIYAPHAYGDNGEYTITVNWWYEGQLVPAQGRSIQDVSVSNVNPIDLSAVITWDQPRNPAPTDGGHLQWHDQRSRLAGRADLERELAGWQQPGRDCLSSRSVAVFERSPVQTYLSGIWTTTRRAHRSIFTTSGPR